MKTHPGFSQRRSLRARLFDRARGLCEYCWTRTSLRVGTIDHYLPRALLGGNEFENLRWCCKHCNEEKADMHPDAWMPIVSKKQINRMRSDDGRTPRQRLLSEIAQRYARMMGKAPKPQEKTNDNTDPALPPFGE